MTVSELIEELRKYPADMQCVKPCGSDVYIKFVPELLRKRDVFTHAERIWGKDYWDSDCKLYEALEIC
jgi:hypothetical protein